MSNGCDRRFFIVGEGKSQFASIALALADYSALEERVIASAPPSDLIRGHHADFIAMDEFSTIFGEVKTVDAFDLTKQLSDTVGPYIAKEETPHQGKPKKFYHEINDNHNRKKGMR